MLFAPGALVFALKLVHIAVKAAWSITKWVLFVIGLPVLLAVLFAAGFQRCLRCLGKRKEKYAAGEKEITVPFRLIYSGKSMCLRNTESYEGRMV